MAADPSEHLNEISENEIRFSETRTKTLERDGPFGDACEVERESVVRRQGGCKNILRFLCKLVYLRFPAYAMVLIFCGDRQVHGQPAAHSKTSDRAVRSLKYLSSMSTSHLWFQFCILTTKLSIFCSLFTSYSIFVIIRSNVRIFISALKAKTSLEA